MKRALLMFLLLLPVTVHAQTSVIVRGKISTVNQTTTPLANAGVFTGGWESARDYTTLTVTVFADKASAASGFVVQWSSDAVNIDFSDTYSVSANVGATWTTVSKNAYFRVVYTNGAVTQTVFRLAAIQRQSGAPGYAENNLTDAQIRATPLPISGTVTANAGTGPWPITDNSGSITVDGTFWQATQPVSGTFWQATQPVSGTVTANAGTGTLAVSGPVTDAQIRATPLPVSGTVTVTDGSGALNTIVDSGTITTVSTVTAVTAISNALPAGNNNIGDVDVLTLPSVAQATAANLNAQVQGAGASGAAKAGNPVQQGGVFNTTQPTVTNGQGVEAQMTARGAQIVAPGVDGFAVTGTVTTTPPANASTNLAQLAGTTTDTNSGNKSAGTLRVVLATDQPALTNKLLVTPDSVALPANQSVNVAQFGGTNVSTGTGAGGTGIPRVTVSNDSNVIVTPPTLTKGTQGSTGFSTQDLHDAGRTAISFYANNVAAGTTTTETLITLTQSKGTGATSSASTYTITNGKTLRLTAISVGSRGHATATIQSTIFNLRLNTGGACIVTSTPILVGMQSATPATASAWDRVIIPIPDGYEIAGNGTIAICISAAATYTTNAPTWSVNLIGYEY